jgi:hypothetical protein
MGLEYLYKDGEKACSKGPLKVKLDGTLCGEIRKVKDGFQYFAKGDKKGGGIFNKVSEVQNSLLSIQSRRVKAKTPADDSAEMIKEAKKGIEKMEGELKRARGIIERATVLLQASFDMFGKQRNTVDPINLLIQVVNYDGLDCDGHTLYEDLGGFLEG